MRRRAVFFDRDNTLIVGNEYLGDPAKVVLMPGAADAVARARALGFATVIVSNQSGVARGMFGEEAVHAVNRRGDELVTAPEVAEVSSAGPETIAKPQARSRAAREATPSPIDAPSSPQVTRLVHLSEQILGEIKNLREQPPVEFSLSKLFAGIIQ